MIESIYTPQPETGEPEQRRIAPSKKGNRPCRPGKLVQRIGRVELRMSGTDNGPPAFVVKNGDKAREFFDPLKALEHFWAEVDATRAEQ